MRDLADASVEGLLVCDGETIVSVNTSFANLTGLSASSLAGARLETCFPDKAARARLLSGLEPDGRNPLAPSRRLDDPRRADPAADRFCRTAASCRRRSRSAGAQGGRAAYPLSRASRRADVAAQSQPFQRPDRPGNRRPGRGRKSRRALPRSRPVQGSQRPVRPRRGRHGASDRGFARHRGARRASDDGASGGRRVRRSDARRCKSRRGKPACRDHSGSAAHDQRYAGDQQHLDEHRHRALSRRRDGSSGAAHSRRHGALSRQDRRPQHLSLLRGKDGRRGSRTPDART